MNYFLAKTDPDTYSISDLKRDGETVWDGVHNFAALKAIKSWKVGDGVFIYHSQGESRIVGLARVISEPYKDDNDVRGISWVARIKYVREFDEEEKVSLKTIKESGLFDDFLLVKQGRLSTMECPDNFVDWLKKRVNL